MIDYANPRVSDIAMYLKAAKAAVGTGRFTISIGDGSEPDDFYMFHKWYPTHYAFEQVKLVGKGSVEVCLRALPQYIIEFSSGTNPDDLATIEDMVAKLGQKQPDTGREQ